MELHPQSANTAAKRRDRRRKAKSTDAGAQKKKKNGVVHDLYINIYTSEYFIPSIFEILFYRSFYFIPEKINEPLINFHFFQPHVRTLSLR